MILDRYLQKIGVKSYQDLTNEEKETYKYWEEALSGRKLTDKDVDTFFSSQLEDIMAKLPNDQNSDKLDTFLKMKLSFIRSVMQFLDSPRMEALHTEKEIENLLDKTP